MRYAKRNLSSVLASLAGILAVCAAVSVPGSAWAYSADSTDTNIMKSCKGFTVSDSGVLSAETCNMWAEDGTITGIAAHTIDLDEKIGYKDGALKYDESNFSSGCTDEDVTTSGGKLTLKATCSEKTVGIRVDDRIENVGLRTGTPGLYWSDELSATSESGVKADAPAIPTPTE